MITKTDLKWWLDLEPELDWKFAVKYAESAPHEYVTAEHAPALEQRDLVRAAHVIRTFGQPQKFFKGTRIYLETPMGFKHWDMQPGTITDENVNLINRGRSEHSYGVQNAPRTASHHDSPYDGLATTWDREHGMTEDERAATAQFIRANLGEKLWRTLDIGCGTGWPVTDGLVDEPRYVGIDPSTGMLNALVAKHPHVAGAHPMTHAEAEHRRVLCGTQFDTVLLLGGSAMHLAVEDFETLFGRAKRGVVMMLPLGGSTEDWLPAEVAGLVTSREEARRFVVERSVAQTEVGRFSVHLVERDTRVRGG